MHLGTPTALAILISASSVTCARSPAQPHETPRLVEVERLATPAGDTMVLRAPVPGVSWLVGLAVACEGGSPRIAVQLGAFPRRPRVLQLAVRAPNGRVELFGPAFRASAASGFHSPDLEEPTEITRFASAAFEPGALVSNGYQSFFFDAAPADAASLQTFLDGCA